MAEEDEKIVETKETTQKQNTTTSKNSLATAGLVLGIIGVILAFIPILNFLSYIFGTLALIFGIITLIKSSKKTIGIIALILGILTFILPYIINVYVVKKSINFINNTLTETIKDSEELIKPDENSKTPDEVVKPNETHTNLNYVKVQGETFIFNNFEITISKDYSFDVVKKEGPYNGTEAIVLPATFKNLKENESNWFSYSEYRVTGSKGLRVDSLCDFFDNSVDYARDLRPGESQTVNFYFAYDGDGRYSIDFGLLSAEKTYEFNVTK